MSSIFSTVPDKDYFGFYSGTDLNYQKVVKFSGFEKKDISRATDIPLTSIRYESTKMPKALKDRLTEWANLFNLVGGYFSGDACKTSLWFKIPNPLLGSITPMDMIRIGRYKKLVSFVLNSLNENQRAN